VSTLFISHSSQDNAAAAEMKTRLAARGYDGVFLDFDPEHGIAAGREWEHELYRALRRASALIVLCSRSSMASKWVFAEIAQARAGGKHVFPVKIETCEIASLLDDRQIVDLTDGSATSQYERLFRGLAEVGLDPREIFSWTGRRPPYPGLDPFDELDAPIFFGRSTEIRSGLDLLSRMRRFAASRLVVVLGASGSGKSSLVRAGLLPRLRRDSDRWLIVEPFRPGKTPLRQMALALSESFARQRANLPWQDLQARLERAVPRDTGSRTDTSMDDLLTDLRVRAGTREATPLVVIDQFEELLDGGAHGNEFLRFLRQVLESAVSPWLTLVTLRSDFLPAFEEHAALKGWATEHLHLPALSRTAIAEVIEAPARLAELYLEPALVSALIADAETDDALPLLAFALRELWERYGDDHRLTLDEYRGLLGGLSGVIGRVAEQALPTLSADEEQALWSAFVRMVRVNDDGRYARSPASWDEIPASAHPLLHRLEQARLLVSDVNREGIRVLEVAHEAVFRNWQRLANWLAENREFLFWRQRLRGAMAEWIRTGRDAEALLRGVVLAEATRWMEQRAATLSDGEQQFIRASGDHHEAEQRRWKEEYETSEQRRRIALSRQLAAQAMARLDDGFDLALLLSVEASREYDTFESRRALFQALVHRPYVRAFLRGLIERQIPPVKPHRNPAIAFSPDGKLLASTGGLFGRDVLLWDLERQQLVGEPLRGHEATVSTVALSADGRLLASGDSAGVSLVWDVPTRSRRGPALVDPETESADPEPVTTLAFHPDRDLLATGTYDDSVRLWEASTGRLTSTLRSAHLRNVTHLAFSRSGKLLAAVGMKSSEPRNESLVEVWDLQTRRTLGEPASANGLSSGRGGAFAWFRDSGESRAVAWEIGGSARLAVPGSSEVWSLDATADGAVCAAGHSDGTLELWAPGTDWRVALPAVHTHFVDNVALSPDGSTLVSTGPDDAIIVWNARRASSLGRRVEGLGEAPVGARALCFGPDGSTLGVLQDSAVAIVDPVRGQVTRRLVLEFSATSIISAHDATWLVTTSSGELLAVDPARLSVQRHVLASSLQDITFVAAGPAGDLAMARSNGEVALATATAGGRPRILESITQSPVTSIAWSLGASLVVAGHEDGGLTIWSPSEPGRKAGSVVDFTENVVDLCFDLDGRLLVAAGHECLTIWEVQPDLPSPATPPTLRLVARYTTGSFIGAPLRIALSPDGRILATASYQLQSATRINLMDGRARQRFGPPLVFEPGGNPVSLAFSPDGRLLAALDDNSGLVLWDFDVASWRARAAAIANRTLTPEERELYVT
jgi:WD40 repeat protein